MPLLELPHTNGCLVCGHANPHGLHLHLFVDPETGVVSVEFTPRIEHIGFDGIIHGGAIATVVDEAMVWATIWAAKRACVAADLYVRFKHSAEVGAPLRVTAQVTEKRPRLIQTSCEVRSSERRIATATAKYVPLPTERHGELMQTFVDEPVTRAAAAMLAEGA